MWEEKSKRLLMVLLLSCLLLLCLRSYISAEEYYLITPEELAELETLLTEQETTIGQLKDLLTVQSAITRQQGQTLSMLSHSLTSWQELIKEHERLLTRSERAALWAVVATVIGLLEGVIIWVIARPGS